MPATQQDRLYGLTTSVAVKPPVYISANYNVNRFGAQTITSSTQTGDRTVTTTEGMRILLLGQNNAVENGIWIARRSFWVRASDFNGPRDAVNGTLVFSITGDCWQVEADDPVIIGVSAINFRETYPFEANLDIFQRCLRVPEASVSMLPNINGRKNKLLAFNDGGEPITVLPESGSASDVLIELANPSGSGLIGLNNGGTVQDAIGYVTLEMLGYLPGVSVSASDALDSFIQLAKAGTCTTLVIESNYPYPLSRSHIFDFPHAIIGRGANFSQGDQIGTSKFVDARGAGANGYLITIADASDQKTYGWTWQGVEVVGVRSDANKGMLISAEGWAFNQTRIFIRNFGKTGLALNAVLDGVMSDIFIGACGGYVDGQVYYGLDLYPDDATYVCNLIGFYRLHIEHCRYMINLAGFDLAFTDCHFEIGSPEYTTDMTPCINVRRLLRPITFTNSYFTAPGWSKLVSGVSDTSDPASVIAKLPHFIGTTHTSDEILGGGEYDSKIELIDCKFSSSGSYALYVNLSAVPVDIINCHAGNVATVGARVPFIIGPRSKVTNNKFFVKCVTGDTSIYADYVNGKVAPAIQIYSSFGSLIGNDILLFNATPSSLAAAVIGNAAQSVFCANKIGGYTQEVSGAIAGSQLYKGVRVTDSSTSMDLLPSSLVSSGASISLRLTSVYTNSYPVYSADSTSFNFSPSSDSGTAYLGLLTARWSEIRAKTATIATSDGRLKTDIRNLTDSEKSVAIELKSMLRAFRFNADAYMPPSDEGKVHFGVIAQDAVAVFEKYGLSADDYAMIVHDVWEEKPAVIDSEGVEISPKVDAGDRYGVRYEEMLAFIIAAM